MCAVHELVGPLQLDVQHGLPQQAAKDRLGLIPEAITHSIRQLVITLISRFMP